NGTPIGCSAAAFDHTNGNLDDTAFVTKLNNGGGLVYSTFLGGSSSDIAAGIAVDGSGNAYVVGQTDSADFPVCTAAGTPVGCVAASFQQSLSARNDAFVTKVDPTGTGLVYSTYLGGEQD